jgi:gas vesicle protein
MRKLMILILGLVIGAALGAALVALLAPAGDELMTNLKRGFAESMEEARKASDERRTELETELAHVRGQEKVAS